MSRLPIHSEYATAVLKCVHNPILVNCSQKKDKKTKTKNLFNLFNWDRYGWLDLKYDKKEDCTVLIFFGFVFTITTEQIQQIGKLE